MKERIRDVLSKADCDYVEIRLEDSQRTSINFTGPDLEECSLKTDFGGNVRALVNGGWGFTTFNDLEDLEGKVELAISHARSIGSRRGESFKLAPVDVVEAEFPLNVVLDPADISLDDKLRLLSGYNRLVLEHDKRITTSSARYHDVKRKLTFANSEGAWVERENIDLAVSAGPMVRNDKGTFFRRAFNGSSNDFGAVRGLEDEVVKACEDTLAISESDSVVGGEYTVILNPIMAGVFIHEAFGHLSEGDNVYEDPNLQKVMKLGSTFGFSRLTWRTPVSSREPEDICP
ncbi:MAG: DNA gyrase modulator [Planctomycetota bacterium]|nr:DNA gyrase modulator [Planctomycetota bacterium]